MLNKIAIMGAGAVGSYIGAFLSKSGCDVTLIDMWGLHVDAIKKDGLRASGTQGDFTVPVRALHITESQAITHSFDTIFLAVKSYDTEWATHFIKRFLSPNGIIISAQNCMNDEIIASIAGYNRTVGCVMSGITVALWEPGHVSRGGKPGNQRGHDVFRVGELHGRITNRINSLAKLLHCIDAAKTTTNIWGERWSKLTTNASSNPVTAMSGMGSSSAANYPNARWIQTHITREAVLVGQALGYNIEPISGIPAEKWAKADQGDIYEELESVFASKSSGPDWKSSMAQDVTKGRRTEIEYMNGYIVEQGRIAGIPTPVNCSTVKIIRGIDQGQLTANASTLDLVSKTPQF